MVFTVEFILEFASVTLLVNQDFCPIIYSDEDDLFSIKEGHQ
jgi:hypothetical protein